MGMTKDTDMPSGDRTGESVTPKKLASFEQVTGGFSKDGGGVPSTSVGKGNSNTVVEGPKTITAQSPKFSSVIPEAPGSGEYKGMEVAEGKGVSTSGDVVTITSVAGKNSAYNKENYVSDGKVSYAKEKSADARPWRTKSNG